MSDSLEALATNDPSRSAVFVSGSDSSPEAFGRNLFIHHELRAICVDTKQEEPEEQIRGMATVIWDGLPAEDRAFWTDRATVARLVRDREEFLLTDCSTRLSTDHREKAASAFAAYKRGYTGQAAAEAASAKPDHETSKHNEGPSPVIIAQNSQENRAQKADSPIHNTSAGAETDPEVDLDKQPNKANTKQKAKAKTKARQKPRTKTQQVANDVDFEQTVKNGNSNSPTVEALGSDKNQAVPGSADDETTTEHTIQGVAANNDEEVRTPRIKPQAIQTSFTNRDLAIETFSPVSMSSGMSSVLPEIFDASVTTESVTSNEERSRATSAMDWAEEMDEQERNVRASNQSLKSAAEESTSKKPAAWSAIAAPPKPAMPSPATTWAQWNQQNPGQVESCRDILGSMTHGSQGASMPSANSQGSSRGRGSGNRGKGRKKWQSIPLHDTPTERTQTMPETFGLPNAMPTATYNPDGPNPFPDDGMHLYLDQVLAVILEDLGTDEADDYAKQIALSMWEETTRPEKREWLTEALNLRGNSRVSSAILLQTQRFVDRDAQYRTRLIKALAVRNDNELKYLQPEFERILKREARAKRKGAQHDGGGYGRR